MGLELFLLAFIVYLPFYLALLFFLKSKISGYRIHTHVVSLLATSRPPWSTIFNGSTILYGTLSLALPISIFKILEVNTYNMLGVIFLISTAISTAMVGIFPMHRKKKEHSVVSYLVFSSVVLTGLVFIPVFQQNIIFSQYNQIMNYLVIGLTTFLVLNALFYKKANSLLEWLTLIGTIVWNILLSASFLAIYLRGV